MHPESLIILSGKKDILPFQMPMPPLLFPTLLYLLSFIRQGFLNCFFLNDLRGKDLTPVSPENHMKLYHSVGQLPGVEKVQYKPTWRHIHFARMFFVLIFGVSKRLHYNRAMISTHNRASSAFTHINKLYSSERILFQIRLSGKGFSSLLMNFTRCFFAIYPL